MEKQLKYEAALIMNFDVIYKTCQGKSTYRNVIFPTMYSAHSL